MLSPKMEVLNKQNDHPVLLRGHISNMHWGSLKYLTFFFGKKNADLICVPKTEKGLAELMKLVTKFEKRQINCHINPDVNILGRTFWDMYPVSHPVEPRGFLEKKL